MNILTDVLSLIRRSVYAKKALPDDVLILGTHEQPEMTGVASPIPYKSVKVIKVRDFKIAAEHCSYANAPAVPTSKGQIYQKTVVDPKTDECTVYFRSLKSLSSNLSVATSSDNDYVELATTGEPNTAANVGTGLGIYKDKVGETLNFRSLVQGSGITISESTNEITISAPSASLGYKVYTAELSSLGLGTGAPVATIMQNTIGNIVWTRTAEGSYVGTLSGAFTSNKTFLVGQTMSAQTLVGGTGNWPQAQTMVTSSVDEVKIYNFGLNLSAGNQLSDNMRIFLEIRIYT